VRLALRQNVLGYLTIADTLLVVVVASA